MKRRSWFGVGALFSVATAAWAYQEVEVNGEVWGCENRCVVKTYPGGGWSIKDSLGGYIVFVPR